MFYKTFYYLILLNYLTKYNILRKKEIKYKYFFCKYLCSFSKTKRKYNTGFGLRTGRKD